MKTIRSKDTLGRSYFFNFDKQVTMPTVNYTYTNKVIMPKWLLTIDLDIAFFDGTTWTVPKKIHCLIDTGASPSHISQAIVPQHILELNKGYTSNVQGAMGAGQSIIVSNIQLHFPGKCSNNSPFIFFLQNAPAIDDIKTREERKNNGNDDFDMYLGQDILSKGRLFYNGTQESFTLNFKINQ